MPDADDKDKQLQHDIREYFKNSFNLDLTDEQLLECQQSLVSLGHAIAKWRELSHDKLQISN
jgi:hypothetical protein